MSEPTLLLGPQLTAMVGSSPVAKQRDLTVRQVTIDRVPVFWVDAPGETHIGLSFRVGQTDETLATHGLTRLVQRVIVAQLRQSGFAVDGLSGPVITSFTASGTSEQMVELLAQTCGVLREMSTERIETEARSQRGEARRGGSSVLGMALSNVFGAQGLGLMGHEEWGLAQVSADDIESWRDKWFHAGNAALWVAGPPPRRARLPLPAHRSALAAVASPEPIEQLPFWCGPAEGGVQLAATVRRSPYGEFVAEIISERLLRTLRSPAGRPYRLTAEVDGVGANHDLFTLWCNGPEQDSQMIQAAMLRELRSLAAAGPGLEELRLWRVTLERHRNTAPEAGASEASHAARCFLLDEVFVPLADAIAAFPTAPSGRAAKGRDHDCDEIVASVADYAAELEQSAVWALTGGVEDRRIPRVRNSSTQRVYGSRHRSAAPASNPRSASVLVIDTSGVSLEVDAVTSWTVLLDDLAVAVAWNDGGWTLVGRDGFGVAVHPREWIGIERPLERLTAAIPQQLVRRSGEPFLGDAVPELLAPKPPAGLFDRLSRRSSRHS